MAKNDNRIHPVLVAGTGSICANYDWQYEEPFFHPDAMQMCNCLVFNDNRTESSFVSRKCITYYVQSVSGSGEDYGATETGDGTIQNPWVNLNTFLEGGEWTCIPNDIFVRVIISGKIDYCLTKNAVNGNGHVLLDFSNAEDVAFNINDTVIQNRPFIELLRGYHIYYLKFSLTNGDVIKTKLMPHDRQISLTYCFLHDCSFNINLEWNYFPEECHTDISETFYSFGLWDSVYVSDCSFDVQFTSRNYGAVANPDAEDGCKYDNNSSSAQLYAFSQFTGGVLHGCTMNFYVLAYAKNTTPYVDDNGNREYYGMASASLEVFGNMQTTIFVGTNITVKVNADATMSDDERFYACLRNTNLSYPPVFFETVITYDPEDITTC